MREKIVCLCTCTSIEIMTVVGVTSYLIYLNETILALISSVVFAKLIIFHFVMDYYDKKSEKKKMNGMNHSLIKKKTAKRHEKPYWLDFV